MCDFDYIPLDQAVIDQAVEELQKRRNEARELLAEAIKDKSTGGNFDIIAFRNDRKRIVRALEDLRIFWCESDGGEILASRHEIYDAVLPKK